MTSTPMASSQSVEKLTAEMVVTKLREAADFYEANPDAPTSGEAHIPLRQYADTIDKALADRPVEDGERLREALTPSADTKAAYMGEFSFTIPDANWSDDGEWADGKRVIQVPWTTIKEIMAAISSRAALAASSPNRTEGGK